MKAFKSIDELLARFPERRWMQYQCLADHVLHKDDTGYARMWDIPHTVRIYASPGHDVWMQTDIMSWWYACNKAGRYVWQSRESNDWYEDAGNVLVLKLEQPDTRIVLLYN